MKKVFLIFLCMILLGGCSKLNYVPDIKAESEAPKEVNGEYVKSVWLAYYELENFTKNNSESEFSSKIDNAFKELSNMGFNTVTVQVRPCADAFYNSDYFPSSKYCFGKQGSKMEYDPLSIMCDLAQKNDLKLEAWINPYRVSQDDDINELSDDNIAKEWYSDNKTKSNVYIDDKIYFNPASSEVTKLIVNGVKEIVSNYNVSAIHFDDYFYPTTDKKIDKKEYEKYTDKGGNLSLYDWRRSNVSKMIESVYKAVKSVNKEVKFGVSPAANIKNDYNTLYADVEKWISEEGYVDYIVPQVYFGFKNTYQPFMFTTKKWMYLSKCDLYIGLPLYKSGKADKYASEDDKSIINEFKNNSNIIARQITYLSKLNDIKGFYVFSYGSLSDEKCKDEVENMLEVMQSSNPE